MKYLVILSESPYRGERTYNGLQLAGALTGKSDAEVRTFLMGDAALAATGDDSMLNGYFQLEALLSKVGQGGGVIGVCECGMRARGINADCLVDSARESTLDELTEWSEWADKVFVF